MADANMCLKTTNRSKSAGLKVPKSSIVEGPSSYPTKVPHNKRGGK